MSPARQPGFRSLAFVALFLSPFFHGGTALAADGHPLLDGRWVLNRHDSDDVDKKLRDNGRHWFSRVFARSRADSDDDGQDGDTTDDGGQHGSGTSLTGVPRLQHELFDSDRMRIDQHAGIYRITYADGAVREIRGDDPGHSISASGKLREGKFGYTIPYWDGDTLVLETHSDSGRQTLERYTLKNNGSQLLLRIVLNVPERSEPLVLRRVFERAGP